MFELPDRGVWLLTAGNGAGKTSLLACLRRIGNSNAFPLHFPSSNESDNLDNFEGASITYETGGDNVVYAYGGTRWVPRPRKNSHLLSKFGYPQVIYIGANAERLTPRADDFIPRNTRPANQTLIDALNQIFETDKFTQLKTVSLSKGPGNRAFLLKTADNPTRYHSEKHFSLGELCVIKLLEGLRECPNQSLILIDELEMALHPRAQTQLYRYLVDVSRQKRLTVIFSTHSISLLKDVDRSKLIFLDRTDTGEVRVVRGCFPTYAIGSITIGEEKAPDNVLYVEDEIAKAIVEPLVQLVLRARFNEDNLLPDVKVVPIGGFDAVVRFLTHHRVLLPTRTKSHALLDADVKDEIVAGWEARDDHTNLARFNDLGEKLDYLPWTPEVAIVNRMNNHRDHVQQQLRTACNDRNIVLDRSKFIPLRGVQGADLRRLAKRILAEIATDISASIGRDYETTLEIICREFAQDYYTNNRAEITNLLLRKIV